MMPLGAAATPRRVPVEDASQVPLARSLAGEIARAAGFAMNRVHDIELAATELAENLHRYGVNGELMVLPPSFGGDLAGSLTLLAVDHGPGVESFHLCLVDGYSTGGTMGTGLGAVRRLASRFDAVSEPGRGTVVAATFTDPRNTAASALVFDIGAVGIPVPPEVVNGDGFAVVQRGSRLIAMVADGLGHGEGAAVAAKAVTDVVSDVDLAPAALLAEAGGRAAHTRGAAATVVQLTLDVARDGGLVTTSGMGNVSLLMVSPDAVTKRAALSHGTVGAHVGTLPAERRESLAAGGVVVLHTDGLTSRWALDNRVELLRHSSIVIAAVLWRDFMRGTDDSLVLVVRAGAIFGGAA